MVAPAAKPVAPTVVVVRQADIPAAQLAPKSWPPSFHFGWVEVYRPSYSPTIDS